MMDLNDITIDDNKTLVDVSSSVPIALCPNLAVVTITASISSKKPFFNEGATLGSPLKFIHMQTWFPLMS